MVYKHYFKHYAFFSKIVVVFYCFEEMCISNVLLDAPSCGLRREAKSFFPLTEIMPLNSNINSNIDNILVQNSNLVF